MNIFCLDYSAERAAQAHCDKHLASQIRETSQMLSTGMVRMGLQNAHFMASTHVNHPCTRWTRRNRGNFLWAAALLIHLISEADYRYGAKKVDGSVKYARSRAIASLAVDNASCFEVGAFHSPPQVMPPDFQGTNTVEAYRDYYRSAKRHFARWTRRSAPDWWNQC